METIMKFLVAIGLVIYLFVFLMRPKGFKTRNLKMKGGILK
jgi:hypothetical protein